MYCFLLNPLFVGFGLCKTFVSLLFTLPMGSRSLSLVSILYQLSSFRLYTTFLVFAGLSGTAHPLVSSVGFSLLDDENPLWTFDYHCVTRSRTQSYHTWTQTGMAFFALPWFGLETVGPFYLGFALQHLCGKTYNCLWPSIHIQFHAYMPESSWKCLFVISTLM